MEGLSAGELRSPAAPLPSPYDDGGFRREPLDVEHQQMVAFAWKD